MIAYVFAAVAAAAAVVAGLASVGLPAFPRRGLLDMARVFAGIAFVSLAVGLAVEWPGS